MSEAVALGNLTAEHFTPLIGSGFRVSHPHYQETLTLTDVVAGRVPPRGGRLTRQAFSLFFKGESKTTRLNQFTHPLEQDSFGRLEIFLVPIGRNEDETFQYQAVFS